MAENRKHATLTPQRRTIPGTLSFHSLSLRVAPATGREYEAPHGRSLLPAQRIPPFHLAQAFATPDIALNPPATPTPNQDNIVIYKIRNSATQQALPLPPGTHSVGRDEQSYIFIEDASVSRRHAILINRDDNLYVEDLASANGTMLNRERIKGVHRIKFGDMLQFGLVSFSVEPETAPVPTAPLPVGKALPAQAPAAQPAPAHEEATGTRSMKFFQAGASASTRPSASGPLRRPTESLPAIRFDPREATPAPGTPTAGPLQRGPVANGGEAAAGPLKPVSPRLAPRMGSSDSGLLPKKSSGPINPTPPISGDISTPAPTLERGSTVPLPKKRLPSGVLNTPISARRLEPEPPPPSARVGENGEIIITPQPKKSGVFEQYRVSPLPNGEVATAGPKVPTSKLNFGLERQDRQANAVDAAPAQTTPPPVTPSNFGAGIQPAPSGGGIRPGSQYGRGSATSAGPTMAPAPVPPVISKPATPSAFDAPGEDSPSGTQPLPKIGLNRPTEKILPAEAMAVAEKNAAAAAARARDNYTGSPGMSSTAMPAPGWGDPAPQQAAAPMAPGFAMAPAPIINVPATPAPVVQVVMPSTPWVNLTFAFIGGAGTGIAAGLLLARLFFM
ncbi:hypothetical protein DB346_24795 [Verrucomicrobia bacterium LW23]|nr:hypothetical protein DB346_24795 [Verrucomicrobia bacterium LW23]